MTQHLADRGQVHAFLDRPDDRRDQLSELLAWVVGPAAAGIVALVVVLAW